MKLYTRNLNFSIDFSRLLFYSIKKIVKIGQNICMLFLCFHSRFIINLAVDSSLKDDVEPAMIAFHFKTTFTAHPSGNSGVYMSWKKGPGGFEEIIEDQNTWIDDDGKYFFLLLIKTNVNVFHLH